MTEIEELYTLHEELNKRYEVFKTANDYYLSKRNAFSQSPYGRLEEIADNILIEGKQNNKKRILVVDFLFVLSVVFPAVFPVGILAIFANQLYKKYERKVLLPKKHKLNEAITWQAQKDVLDSFYVVVSTLREDYQKNKKEYDKKLKEMPSNLQEEYKAYVEKIEQERLVNQEIESEAKEEQEIVEEKKTLSSLVDEEKLGENETHGIPEGIEIYKKKLLDL